MNNDISNFFMWVMWGFCACGPPHFIHNFLIQCYSLLNVAVINFNEVMYSDYWDVSSETGDENNKEISCIQKIKPKYEDKYLDAIKKLDNEWQFTKDELKEKEIVYEDFYKCSVKNIQDEIDTLYKQVCNYKKEIEDDTNNVNYIENFDENFDEIFLEDTTFEERNEARKEQIQILVEKINCLNNKIDTDEALNNIKIECQQQAILFFANKKIEKLKLSYVMEKTPHGNALMVYDNDKGSFKYYSDSTIPYKYLDVVARKYVKMFNCRPLFIDMDEELNLFEEKMIREDELKKVKETDEKLKAEEVVNNNPTKEKKNVFVKFKSYNKDTGGKINMAACPKNSIPNNTNIQTKEPAKIILKERVNRYTYGGKFSNFNFLQKVDKKVFNKKLGFSFADFKKMQK